MPKPRKKPEKPLTLLGIDRVSMVDKGDNPTAHILIHKRRAAAKLKVNDRVKIKRPHAGMAIGDEGVVTEVSPETAYAIKMEGMDKSHKWYVDSELEATAETTDDAEDIDKAIQRGRSMQRMCNDVERAVQQKWGGEGWAYCKETYPDAVIFEQGGKQYRAPYTMEESETEGEMMISLGDREQAETVYETQKGEQMTLEELSTKFTSLEGTLAETTKRAERAEGIAKFTAEERQHFDKLNVADQDAFLNGDVEFRKAKIEAAKPAPVQKTAIEIEVEKLREENRTAMDRINKAELKAELAEYSKRARTELANLPGTDEEKGAMLRSVEKIDDPKVREVALKALKAGDAAQAALGKNSGILGGEVANGAYEKIEKVVSDIRKAENVSEAKAWQLALERQPDLYREYKAEKAEVN